MLHSPYQLFRNFAAASVALAGAGDTRVSREELKLENANLVNLYHPALLAKSSLPFLIILANN